MSFDVIEDIDESSFDSFFQHSLRKCRGRFVGIDVSKHFLKALIQGETCKVLVHLGDIGPAITSIFDDIAKCAKPNRPNKRPMTKFLEALRR